MTGPDRLSTDAVLRRALIGDGAARVVTLDPSFQGLPDTAHGGTILAAQPGFEQNLKPETAYLTADLMRSVIDDPAGTAHSLSALDRAAAGKTGTASEHRDAW